MRQSQAGEKADSQEIDVELIETSRGKTMVLELTVNNTLAEITEFLREESLILKEETLTFRK